LEKITENCNCYGLHHVFGISVEDLHNMLKELKFASNRGYEKSFKTQIQEMLRYDELMIEFPGVQALMEEEVHFHIRLHGNNVKWTSHERKINRTH
jgi:hypothetical protein